MLSKETKVGVKNKENKTACFIEMEGLLNSPELIGDLPGWELKNSRARVESGRSRAGERSQQELPALSDWLEGPWRCRGLQRGSQQLVFCTTDKSRLWWGEGFGTLASLLTKSCFWTLSVCHHPHQPLGRSPVPSLPTSQGWAEAKWHPADSQKLPARPSRLSQGAPKNSALSSWYPLPLPKEW